MRVLMSDANLSHQPSNVAGCYIKRSEGKGRGVYGKVIHLRSELSQRVFSSASRPIPSRTVIETNPILFFTKEEYEAHGKFTILDQYTFRCRDGRMALALGLGMANLSKTQAKPMH
jgi:tRNA-specific adenosine deaminase 3